ncbi:MAG: alpha/beta hydrolase [Planctomycetaceae bacterium]
MTEPTSNHSAPKSSAAKNKPPRTFRQRLKRAVFIYAVVPYLTITLLAFLFQRQLMYHPTRAMSLDVKTSGLNADQVKDVAISVNDGVTLRGWHLLGRNVTATPAESDPHADKDSVAPLAAEAARPEHSLVIYFPGNAQNRLLRLADLKEIQSCGADVLIFDYRGFGDSTGSPREVDMEADARAVWNFAQSELGFKDHQIILFGESLGGAVVLSLWSAETDPVPTPKAVILNSTFASMPRMAAATYPYFPFRWMVIDQWPSFERIARVNCPIIQFHGDSDELVPLEEAEFLRSCARTSVEFQVIKGGTHNGLPTLPLRRTLKELIFGKNTEPPKF